MTNDNSWESAKTSGKSNSHLNARLVSLDEYLCEDAVVVDLHGDDGLVRLNLAQHVSRPDLVALLQNVRSM